MIKPDPKFWEELMKRPPRKEKPDLHLVLFIWIVLIMWLGLFLYEQYERGWTKKENKWWPVIEWKKDY